MEEKEIKDVAVKKKPIKKEPMMSQKALGIGSVVMISPAGLVGLIKMFWPEVDIPAETAIALAQMFNGVCFWLYQKYGQ